MTKSWDDWNVSPELAKRISDEWAKIFERKTPLSPPLTIMSRLHEADEPGKIEGLLNIPHLDIPMTYEPKMPAWGLTPPAMVVIPPDRPDVEQVLRNIMVCSPPLTVMGIVPRLVRWNDATDHTDWERPAGSFRVIDFFTAREDRRRQKRLDRGIKLKAPPSRGWARHIRKQKARRGR